jgi:hypothetical protein
VLQHLTPTVIAENLETSLVWTCIGEAIARWFETDSDPTTIQAPALPVVGAKPKAASGASASGKIDVAPPPPRPPAAPAPVTTPSPIMTKGSTLPSDWKAVDELDLLEEETLPPRPART